jgi:predicted ATP-binding protein involved in virulence
MTDDWRVKWLRLQNFRQLTDFEIDLSGDVTLLVGTNGSGKSSVLDALAIMLSSLVVVLGGESRPFNQADARRVVRDLGSTRRIATEEPQYPVAGQIDALVAGKQVQWSRRLGSAKGRTSPGEQAIQHHMREVLVRATSDGAEGTVDQTLPILAHYGVERLVGTRAAHGAIPSSRTGAYVSALDPRSDLTRLASFLESLDGQILAARAYEDDVPTAAIEQFRAIGTACASILEPVGWTDLRWNRGIQALTLSHPEQGTLPLTSLASGTKIAAGLAIDLASRMARANPHLGAHELLTRTPGIVLIDEVDLHLHPTWQQQIVIALRRTFPRVQFVLSTHSPQVIATVESENIRILRGDSVSIPRYANGLLPEAVLSQVQDTDPEPTVPARKALERYLKAVYNGQGRQDDVVQLRRQIEETLGGVSLNPELIEADSYIAYTALID